MKKIKLERVDDFQMVYLINTIKSQVRRPDRPHTIFVWEDAEKRTLPQLRYYWGVVLEDIADATGYYPDEIHDFNKKNFGLKSTYFIGDEAAELIKGLSKMNKEQAKLFIDRVINYWIEKGVTIREPQQLSNEELVKAYMSDGED